MNVWREVLDSCPGLLCCVVNLKGRLVHATHGYRSAASRLFGHKCEEGRAYPPLVTKLDEALHDVLTAACLGEVNAIEITEGPKVWELTASPLRLEGKNISGVVIRIMPSENQQAMKSHNLPPVIRSNPDILNSVPFRAGIVNSHGVFLAVNKYLASATGANLTGRNITELADKASHTDIMHIIMKNSGSAECKMSGIAAHENFYPSPESVYLDSDFNDEPEEDKPDFLRIRLHAGPIDWDGGQAVLITFEDITDFVRAHDQLRRLLTVDAPSGILNRRGIEHVILRETGSSIRSTEHLSLIMMSLDNFREVTSTQGYLAGNRIIREFVYRLKQFLSDHAEAIPGRWGGDEFMILVHCSGASAVVLANEIRDRARGLAMSAGVADLNAGGYLSVNEFIAAAYDALSEARREGGNQTVLAGKK